MSGIFIMWYSFVKWFGVKLGIDRFERDIIKGFGEMSVGGIGSMLFRYEDEVGGYS